MSGFLEISKIYVPFETIEFVYKHLRKMGTKGLEGVGLLAGCVTGNSFQIKTAIIPKQTSLGSDEGLLYSVDGDELHRMNKFLYKENLTLICQIHSHPAKAYHSETDDLFPIVSTIGGISIVIPNFASNPISIEYWAVYRLGIDNNWKELSNLEVHDLIKLIE